MVRSLCSMLQEEHDIEFYQSFLRRTLYEFRASLQYLGQHHPHHLATHVMEDPGLVAKQRTLWSTSHRKGQALPDLLQVSISCVQLRGRQ